MDVGTYSRFKMQAVAGTVTPKSLNYVTYYFYCIFTSVADPGSKKSAKIMENFPINKPTPINIIDFFFKTIKLMLTDIYIYPINNKTYKYIFFRKKSKIKVDIFPTLGRIWSMIRIHIKMKQIRNTDFYESHKKNPSLIAERYKCKIYF